MINTDDILLEVEEEIEKIIKKEPTTNKMIQELKNILLRSVTCQGITVDDCVKASSRMIVLASMV